MYNFSCCMRRYVFLKRQLMVVNLNVKTLSTQTIKMN